MCKGLSYFDNIIFVRKDLAIEVTQHLSDEHRICKDLRFNVIEEVEELLVVLIQESKA